MIYYRKWYEAGIFTISDIVVNGNIASFDEIANKFPIIRTDILKFYGLISILPSEWKNIINRNTNHNLNIDLHSNTGYKINQLKKYSRTCSSVVRILRDNLKTFPEFAFEKWKLNLNLPFDKDDYLQLFKKMYLLSSDNKLLILQYRLLHRNIVTNKTLHIWDQNKPLGEQHTENCTFCDNNVETIEHLFYDCVHTKKIWLELFKWIYDNSGLRINFSRFEVILSATIDELKIFNLIFMIVKNRAIAK